MAIYSTADRRLAEKLSRLIHSNPFLPEWVECERDVLGSQFQDAPQAYSRRPRWATDHLHPNILAIGERVDRLVEKGRQALVNGAMPAGEELLLYEDLAAYYLYRCHGADVDALIEQQIASRGIPSAGRLWERFVSDFERVLPADRKFPSGYTAAHGIACFYQDRRAFYHIYRNILGSSAVAARLRGAVWQSIFTHDIRRHAHALHARMSDFPTLITGPSGTGKELVARAIGLSGYVAFDVNQTRFTANFKTGFLPLNLSALASTLIESELFGHRKGSFSGAIEDRVGWLEQCGTCGAVFLDEIGELDPAIQVKLLRVLQDRHFQRLGDTETRTFTGKIIAATNRDLAVEMQSGRFRADFYWRLCADRITTPSLHEQLADAPGDLSDLVLFLVRDLVGHQAEAVTAEVVQWIEQHLGVDYTWPGNFRELEQCLRSYLIRREYHPPHMAPPADDLPALVAAGALSAAELERRYFALVYAQAGTWQEAARRLKIDWRTLRSKLK